MTKMLENAVARLQTLPPDMQDQVARLLLAYVGEEEPAIELTLAEEADLVEAQAEMARSEFATDAELTAVFAVRPESNHQVRWDSKEQAGFGQTAIECEDGRAVARGDRKVQGVTGPKAGYTAIYV